MLIIHPIFIPFIICFFFSNIITLNESFHILSNFSMLSIIIALCIDFAIITSFLLLKKNNDNKKEIKYKSKRNLENKELLSDLLNNDNKESFQDNLDKIIKK